MIPKRLLKRLRNPVTFLPAYYEIIVGAALAVAGMEISNAETKPGSAPTPEFRAKSKRSGATYEVEAKRKERWKAQTDDVSAEAFQRELESYVRDQIYAASKKKMTNPIFWFELSIPTLRSKADWSAIAAKAKAVIRDAEKNMTVEGKPIAPAFVVITNHTFLSNEDIEGEPSFCFLEAINVDDHPFGRDMEIEAALAAYDKYRDISLLIEAWKLGRTVPTSFDGTPPELLAHDGTPQRTVTIGDVIEARDIKGQIVRATVEEIATIGDKAMVIVGADDRHWLVEMSLSEAEAQAAARFTDAVFGKNNATRVLNDSHPFDLYDWMLSMYAEIKPEQLAKLISEDAGLREFDGLPQPEARVRIARQYTKRIWAASQAKIGNATKPG